LTSLRFDLLRSPYTRYVSLAGLACLVTHLRSETFVSKTQLKKKHMSSLFSTFGINWQLLLAQGINFGILLGVLWYFLYKPLSKMIDARAMKIADGVKAAEAAHVQLEQTGIEHDQIISAASLESEKMIAEARARAAEKAAELIGGAESRSESILADAAARAEEAKRQAMKESEKEIARAAILAAEKVLRAK
jgi:F-type H+-transporting ATPase subunit b